MGKRLDTVLKLYRPNVGGGNFDAPARARNEGLKEAAVALGLTTLQGWDQRCREIDTEAWNRSEAFLTRFSAEEAAKAAKEKDTSSSSLSPMREDGRDD